VSQARACKKLGALLKNGFALRRQNRGTLRGEVFVSFIYIQSELMNVSAGAGYVYN